ncbi:MAG: hypothetical protein HZB75_00180 [Candidatus Saccharibacteria bacterium]|nr:MAG: hypothetical protein HZB75_00180 [Candidatus Saccharibacteria bacterium]
MNKLIRTIVVAFVCFGSFNLLVGAYARRGDQEVNLIVLLIGLAVAGIVWIGDIIQRDKNHKIQYIIKPIDYGLIFLWAMAVPLVLNESNISRSVSQIFALRRGYQAFDIVHWFVVFIFIAAISVLAISLLALSRSKIRSFRLRWVAVIVCSVSLILALTVPIGTVHTGSCGWNEVRLSLLSGGQKEFEAVKEQARDAQLRRQQRLKDKDASYDIAEGCSPGLIYVLYIL